MISLYFDGLEERLKSGMSEFAAEYNFSAAETGENCDIAITLCKTEEKALSIERTDKAAKITYCSAAHIFRAVSLILQNIENKSFTSREQVYFDDNCVMLDVSQGDALPKLKELFRTLRIAAAMGFNTFMIYVEDCYEIKSEPYFGYMRPRYTYDDLKAVDDYAYALGIEVVPCMQTLGHLPNILRCNVYYNVKDDDTTLLVGAEETYTLIKKMLEASAAPVRSRRIHIGMDEAWNLGLGRYLTLNGYTDKHRIFIEHLKRVMQIVNEMGLEPMMWGDMFFRSILPDNEYYTEEDIDFPPELINDVPEGIGIIYWDYYNEPPVVENMIKQVKKLDRDIIFAGAVRNNRGFACKHSINTKTANDALTVCKKQGIRRVMATVWGDLCPEGTFYATLLGLQLYAEHAFAETVDKEQWYKRFDFCAKSDAEAFEMIRLFDEFPELGEEYCYSDANPSKALLWQDPMLGMFDVNAQSIDAEKHYSDLAAGLGRYITDDNTFKDMFEFYAAAANALSKKSVLGIKLHKAYKDGDMTEVRKEIDAVYEAVDKLYRLHRDMWLNTCNPVGWEILDTRYGALFNRLRTTADRVDDYISGKIRSIPELEEKQLLFHGKEGLPREFQYTRIISASQL